jgi:hypothetical protein
VPELVASGRNQRPRHPGGPPPSGVLARNDAHLDDSTGASLPGSAPVETMPEPRPIAPLPEPPRAQPPRAQPPLEPQATLAAPPPVELPATAPSKPKRAAPPRLRATHERAAPNLLNDELALLRRVERALRNADPALALALLGELDERFPESRLVEEREAARLMANCRMQSPDAVGHARTFLHEHPASVYRQRVQLACEMDAPSVAKDLDAAPMKKAVTPGH